MTHFGIINDHVILVIQLALLVSPGKRGRSELRSHREISTGTAGSSGALCWRVRAPTRDHREWSSPSFCCESEGHTTDELAGRNLQPAEEYRQGMGGGAAEAAVRGDQDGIMLPMRQPFSKL